MVLASSQREPARTPLGLHLGGRFSLDGDDSPIPDYYRGSSTSVLKQLATLLGTGGPGLSDEALPRVQAWWTWRLAAVTSATEPDGRTELIDTLPALAASGRFPDEWILQQFHVLLDASG